METGNDQMRTGKNIRALRTAYGESQDQLVKFLNSKNLMLGEKGGSRSTISQYEHGTRTPDDDIKRAIAKHYLVTLTELMNTDLSGFNLHLSKENFIAAQRCFDLMFPIFVTDSALSNPAFARAYSQHRKIYDLYMQINIEHPEGNTAFIDNLDLFLTLNSYLNWYSEAYKNDAIKTESAADYIALYHFCAANGQVSDLLRDKSAYISAIDKEFSLDIEIDKVLDFIDTPEIISAMPFFFSFERFHQDHKELLETMMITLHNDQQYADLAVYYDAMEFINNLADSRSESADNKRMGYNLLKQQGKRGNMYAKRYLMINPDPLDEKRMR